MNVMVTGANGMIGSQLVKGLIDTGYKVTGIDRNGEETVSNDYRLILADLGDADRIREIVSSNNIDRIIHLAALAHTVNEDDLSWQRYEKINVECAKNIFNAAGDRPVLFISTVDVFGFFDGKHPVSPDTVIHPVTFYGKSKAMAEEECRKLPHYTIFRFSPVYTESIKRDIQKRYYLKYPTVAYRIGKGSEYEILNIEKAIHAMVSWCSEEPENDIRIIKDDKKMWTPDYIRAEKNSGRAKFVLRIPRWMVVPGYHLLVAVLGKNDKTYLLNKAVYPLRSENR